MKTVFLNIQRINYDNKLDLMMDDNIKYYDNTKREDIINRTNGFDVVVTKEIIMDEDIINGLSDSVKMICEAGTGYNNINVAACNKRGIMVSNVPDYASNSVALFTLMFILNMSTSIPKQLRMLYNDDFSNFGNTLNIRYSEVSGKTIGIIGLGKIGQKVALFARMLGMKVITYTRSFNKNFDWVKYVNLDDLLKSSDYISLNCPLNDETYHIINENNINLIKKDSFIINTARGSLIDENALINALKNNNIAGACLDVLEKEPGTKDNELFSFDNVIITPHMAWNSLEARNRLINVVYENIDNFNKGIYSNIINK